MNKIERHRLYWFWAAIVIAAIVLVACVGTAKGSGASDGIGDNVFRYWDEDAGVLCWIYKATATTNGSIDCMPISETLLGK